MEISKGKIGGFTFKSRELEEDIDLLAYLPANFTPLNKYSLLIVQDGKDYFQFGRMGRIADELINYGEIENIIIVGIPYKNIEDRRRKYHPEGEMHQAYIRFLAHELVPFLDEEYPTYQIGMGRALMGDSLAATVSLMAALQYPHTFGKVLLQSPYVDKTVLKKAGEINQPHLVSIYHVIGKKETIVETTDGKKQDFLTPNRELSALLKNKQFPYFYDEFDGDHTWRHWQPDIRRALIKMFS